MGKSRRVHVPAYRVSLSDYTRASTYERARMRSKLPREFRDYYDIKKELAMKEQDALEKTIAGGLRYNADMLNENAQVEAKKLKVATAAFKSKNSKVRTQLMTRTANGPSVLSRRVTHEIGPDGGLYATGVVLGFDMPTGSDNAYQDFQKAQTVRQLALSAHNPGGANFEVAMVARRQSNNAYERFQAQQRARAGSGEGTWDAEIRAQELKRAQRRAEHLAELSEEIVLTMRPGEAQLLEPMQAKTENDALRAKVAYKGIEMGNIPANFKKQEYLGLAYHTTYKRYDQTTLTSVV